MKLNRRTLRKLILAEIKSLQEDRQDYAIGLANKIARLEEELDRLNVMSVSEDLIKEKINQISRLKRRLEALNVMPQARLGTSGIRMLDL